MANTFIHGEKGKMERNELPRAQWMIHNPEDQNRCRICALIYVLMGSNLTQMLLDYILYCQLSFVCTTYHDTCAWHIQIYFFHVLYLVPQP